MTFETNKFDLLYGRVLKIIGNIERAKSLTVVLYQVGTELGLSNEELLKYVTVNGLRFDNTVYDKLNKARTNSSQVGYLDPANIPLSITQQAV